ncbi:malate:quinone oxidoreductase, putative [Eimeria tenella]|uniref:Malate:quinone oxidoreductase, putative n=1 Tax=Eimeria tenella TaxID=5802 RepID=U6KP16_EIMTE|nr:malate:quinone oxidoreductase, putative [Eimeria tenella]CDJ39852.1 malate:quinone oxidoreductase, putative [Eimeria tenella]|eukprot:XP_013230605.1 malate:quinone oxidoreductase, putative [Eimeria tenella]
MPLLFSRAAAAAASAAAATTAAAAAARRCLRGNEKAKVVKRQADMLRNFATKLPPETRDKVIFRFPKMALAVGDEECDFMKKRFQTFKPLFSSLQLVGKTEICELEPRVGMKSSSSPRDDEVCGLFVPNEHTAVNYISLAEAFVSAAKQAAAGKARFVVVSACGHSLLFAQRLGYGLEFSCLPVAGSFYFADKMLNGKVYTVQDARLPFAAVHGDPDILLLGKTRFGPTALPLPLLERNNLKTFFDFAKCVKPDWRLAQVYVQLLNTAYMRAYVFKNFLFEVPALNLHLFAKDLRKIIPSIQVEDLTYAKGFGGIRPQLINKTEKKLLLGEGKIVTGENIIFNITPSPGGTTCLGTAETDMREIVRELQASIDEEKFRKVLLQGEYPVGN